MTFTGFVVTSIVLFAVFYAWYWFVHRNGESTPQGLENLDGSRRDAGAGLDRRQMQALMAEIGEIKAEDEQQAADFEQKHPREWLRDPHGQEQQNQQSGDEMRTSQDRDELRFASKTGYMTEFGGTFGAYEEDDQRYRLFPDPAPTSASSASVASTAQINTGRMEGVFPPPDIEFAPMPSAHYQNLSNQLPLADDTVMFKEAEENR